MKHKNILQQLAPIIQLLLWHIFKKHKIIILLWPRKISLQKLKEKLLTFNYKQVIKNKKLYFVLYNIK